MNKLIRSIDDLPGTIEKQWLKRYSLDTLLATVLALGVTGIIYILHLYPAIPNISFLYLLVVLGLSSTRGLYAATITSIVAVLSFDFSLTEPLYTFRIAKPEEWLALFIFLVTAIITGRLASALRQRLQQATQHARETRELYDLVNATTNEESLERQLNIVARAIVKNFASLGICDCAFLVPNASGELILQADACQPTEHMTLSPDECKTAASVILENKVIEFYYDAAVSPSTSTSGSRYTRIATAKSPALNYVRFQPLQSGQRVVGVTRLLMRPSGEHFSFRHSPQLAQERLNSQM